MKREELLKIVMDSSNSLLHDDIKEFTFEALYEIAKQTKPDLFTIEDKEELLKSVLSEINQKLHDDIKELKFIELLELDSFISENVSNIHEFNFFVDLEYHRAISYDLEDIKELIDEFNKRFVNFYDSLEEFLEEHISSMLPDYKKIKKYIDWNSVLIDLENDNTIYFVEHGCYVVSKY